MTQKSLTNGMEGQVHLKLASSQAAVERFSSNLYVVVGIPLHMGGHWGKREIFLSMS